MIAATRWTTPGSAASWAGSRARALQAVCARRLRGFSTTAGGGSRSGRGAIAASASARERGGPMKLPAHDRYDYIPIGERRPYEWPGGVRLAVFLCSNIEHFAYREGLGSDPAGLAEPPQSQSNYAWRDYGNRVGLWSYLDLLDEFALPGAHNVNSAALEACPQIVARLNARGDEYIGHGRTNAERQDRLWEEDEARLIAESTEVITRLSGRRPEGWLGPGLAESRVTLDLLKEAGYRYVMDWPMDDQPVWLRTRAGPILSVPYPIELNDLPALVLRHHSGREFAQMVIDQFDEMLARSHKYPLVFAVALHPFVIGQPFRLRAFRDALTHILAHREQLWITTPGAIARYCESLPPGRSRCGPRRGLSPFRAAGMPRPIAPRPHPATARAGAPGALSPSRSSGTNTKISAVSPADSRISGASRSAKTCSYRNEPSVPDRAEARLRTDIRAAKANPSARCGQ